MKTYDTNINFNYLKFFMCAAESKSLGETAEKLGYEVSNVSISIAKLEEQYGVKLFYRDPLTLTDEGKKVYEFVSKAYRELEFSQIIVKDSNNMENANLSIGCPEHIMNSIIKGSLQKILNDYPNLKITLECNPSCTRK